MTSEIRDCKQGEKGLKTEDSCVTGLCLDRREENSPLLEQGGDECSLLSEPASHSGNPRSRERVGAEEVRRLSQWLEPAHQ